MTPTKSFPLAWPAGRPRAKSRQHARFRSSLVNAIKRVQREVHYMGGTELAISCNAVLGRRDGLLPHGCSWPAEDPGVAVYFTLEGKPMCFACDRWHSVDGNMQAIALTITALRGIARWGSGQMVEQAFTGFVALPAPEQPWQVLGLDTSNPTPEQIEEAYRRLAMRHHPDRGGDRQQMVRINAARDALANAKGLRDKR